MEYCARIWTSQATKNSVNLGNLYSSQPKHAPPTWAYFEDGSVFIMPLAWCSHDTVEARMKSIAHFVKSPTPKMQQIRATRSSMKRFIIIDKNGNDIHENMLRILARNARDGQTVSIVDPPFENVELSLDASGTRPVSARFSDAPQLKYEYRVRNSQALETFRGTLVDGVLQPNVRLGNGLRLSHKPEMSKPQITAKRWTQDRGANERSEGADLHSKTSAKPPHQLNISSSKERAQSGRHNVSPSPPRKSPRDFDLERREYQVARRERELIKLQQQLLQTIRAQSKQPYYDKSSRGQRQQTHEPPTTSARTEPDAKIADIEARERALEQQEELLRYKRKTWLLEQKLAQATARLPSRRRSSNPKTDIQERDRDIYEEKRQDHKAMSDSSYANSNSEGSGDYSLHNPPPPEALKHLRSRIRLPTRRTIRSSQKPGY